MERSFFGNKNQTTTLLMKTSSKLLNGLAAAALVLAVAAARAGDLTVDNLTVNTNLTVRGVMSGNGSGVTNLAATSIATGRLSAAVLPTNGVWNVAGLTFSNLAQLTIGTNLSVGGQLAADSLAVSTDLTVGGNVGIGTTTPAQKLSIADGNIWLEAGSTKNLIYTDGWNAGMSVWNYWHHYSVGTYFDTLQLYDEDAAASRLCVTSWGGIGINTMWPESLFHVAGGDVRVSGGGQFVGNGSGLLIAPQGDLSMGPFTGGAQPDTGE